MPKTRTIVALTHPKTGEPIAAGAQVDLDEDAYNALRATGQVEASDEEQKAHATPEAEGNYGARVGRSQAAGLTGEPAAEEEEPPAPKKR